MKTCPTCRKKIHIGSVKCPYCHTQFGAVEMNKGRSESRNRFWLNLGAALIVIYGIGYYFLNPASIERRAQADAQREFNHSP